MDLEVGYLLVGGGHVPDLLVERVPAGQRHHARQLVSGVQRRVQSQRSALQCVRMECLQLQFQNYFT